MKRRGGHARAPRTRSRSAAPPAPRGPPTTTRDQPEREHDHDERDRVDRAADQRQDRSRRGRCRATPSGVASIGVVDLGVLQLEEDVASSTRRRRRSSPRPRAAPGATNSLVGDGCRPDRDVADERRRRRRRGRQQVEERLEEAGEDDRARCGGSARGCARRAGTAVRAEEDRGGTAPQRERAWSVTEQRPRVDAASATHAADDGRTRDEVRPTCTTARHVAVDARRSRAAAAELDAVPQRRDPGDRLEPVGQLVTGKKVPEKRNIGMMHEAEERGEPAVVASFEARRERRDRRGEREPDEKSRERGQDGERRRDRPRRSPRRSRR